MKTLTRLFYMVLILFLVWFCFSYLEIVIKNLDNPQYCNFNFFKIMMNLGVDK